MTKSIFTLVMLLGVFASAHSQSYLRAYAGVNLSNIATDVSFLDDRNQRTTFSAGIGYRRELDEKAWYKIDLQYAQKGFEYDPGIALVVDESDVCNSCNNNLEDSFNYLSIPISLGLNISFGRFSIDPNVGIVNSVLLVSKRENDFGETDLTEGMRRFDFGFLTGLDLAYGVSEKINVLFSSSFQQGVISVTGDGYFKDERILNRNLLFTLGVEYRISKN